jgi:hypothetical protein
LVDYFDDLDAVGTAQLNRGATKPYGPECSSKADPQAAWLLKNGLGRVSLQRKQNLDSGKSNGRE